MRGLQTRRAVSAVRRAKMLVARERFRYPFDAQTPLEKSMGNILDKNINSLSINDVSSLTAVCETRIVEMESEDRAILRVQCQWRARKGRLAAHMKKQVHIDVPKKGCKTQNLKN